MQLTICMHVLLFPPPPQHHPLLQDGRWMRGNGKCAVIIKAALVSRRGSNECAQKVSHIDPETYSESLLCLHPAANDRPIVGTARLR